MQSKINPDKCDKCELNFESLSNSNLGFFLEVRNLVREFLHDPREFTLEDAKIWINSNISNNYIIVSEKKSGMKIGYLRLKELGIFNLQIGLDIHPEYQGIGHATRIYTCFFNHWNMKKDINQFSLQVLSKNTRAISLYKKIGFEVSNITKIELDGKMLENIYMVKYMKF
jgi:RimJ/RimL family protein N-acetyltransferase